MKIAFGAISFELDHFVEGVEFTASDSTNCIIHKITAEYCYVKFQPVGMASFVNKYPLPYRVLKEKFEQLSLQFE